MDDDKINPEEKQPSAQEPRPIFETVPKEEQPHEVQSSPQEPPQPQPQEPPFELQPEEAPPELETPQEAPSNLDENRTKYFIIGAGALFFIIILILILRILLGAGKKEPVRLTYWGLWEDKEVIQPLINAYQEKNKSITIEYQKMSPRDYKDKLIARSKNNQGPDIFRFHNTWIPEIKEVVASLPQSVMSNTEFERTFYPIHQKNLKVGDQYYGIPLMIDGLVLLYNDSLFKKAGISTAPSSWEDVIDYVGKLTVKTQENQIVTAGIALGTAENIEHFQDIFALFLMQNGGDIRKLDQAEAVGALESYRKFAEQPNNFWDETMPNSIDAFIQEKVAMIIVPSWQILTIKKANPELDLRVVPVPAIPGGKPVSIATYWVEGVSKFSKNQKEAWKFLRYLAERENMTRLYELQAKTRPFGAAYSRVDLGQLLAQNEYLGAVIKQADSYVSVPAIARTYDNGLNDDIGQYIKNAINATTQDVSYAEAMRTAKQGVDQIFSRYQIE
ncbi:extracellular solute-binding protein [Candidatus Roizmanbacteria bacterium]|nr:extracellular solute-binding protein [Candidatus Roizmanbacteria bacterium]